MIYQIDPTGRTMGGGQDLEDAFSSIVVSNSNRVGYVVDKDLAISDLSSSGRSSNGCDDVFRSSRGHDQFELYLGYKIYLILGPAIHLLVSLLTPVAAYFAD